MEGMEEVLPEEEGGRDVLEEEEVLEAVELEGIKVALVRVTTELDAVLLFVKTAVNGSITVSGDPEILMGPKEIICWVGGIVPSCVTTVDVMAPNASEILDWVRSNESFSPTLISK